MKAVLCAILLGSAGLLAGCSSAKITIANAGWSTLSVNDKVVEQVACNFDNKTIEAKGVVNYTGLQKPIKIWGVQYMCNNDLKQLEKTFYISGKAK